MKRIRIATVERGHIDPSTGEFPMVLASDGEASDGDILSIEGARFNDTAPLQLSHRNDPTSTLGTISGFKRDMQSTPRKLRAKGIIETEGDGPQADIRRDLVHMISKGHVGGISVSWEPVRYTRRINLASDHPAFVDESKEKDWRKRSGLYHDEWRVMEGSVVAIQADPQAIVGRSRETEGPVSEFWRSMSERTQETIDRPSPLDFESSADFIRAVIPVLLNEGNTTEESAAIASMLWLESLDQERENEVINVSDAELEPETETEPEFEPEFETESEPKSRVQGGFIEDEDITEEAVERAFLGTVDSLINAGIKPERMIELVDSRATEEDEHAEIDEIMERLNKVEAENKLLTERLNEGDSAGLESIVSSISNSSPGSLSASSLIRNFQSSLRAQREQNKREFRAYVETRLRGVTTPSDERTALARQLRERLEEVRRTKGRVNGAPSPPNEDTPTVGLREYLAESRETHSNAMRTLLEGFRDGNKAATSRELNELRELIEMSVAPKKEDKDAE
ncbi:MAG TPA: hypothetical protein VMX15_05755 [Candidatus Heimdallarchaeota archaeon]|nr:hypothetical protein [Candidatus Heimdallarchaeota archaeon]